MTRPCPSFDGAPQARTSRLTPVHISPESHEAATVCADAVVPTISRHPAPSANAAGCDGRLLVTVTWAVRRGGPPGEVTFRTERTTVCEVSVEMAVVVDDGHPNRERQTMTTDDRIVAAIGAVAVLASLAIGATTSSQARGATWDVDTDATSQAAQHRGATWD